MKTFAAVCAVLIPFLFDPAEIRGESADPLIQNVVQNLKQDIMILAEYGAHQRIVTTKLTEQGTPNRVDEKNFQTIWVHNKPKNELVAVSCKELDARTGKARRCYDVRKANSKQNSKPGKIESEIKKIRWTELYKNFEFTLLPKEGEHHVFCFRPKEKGISPSNRIEKLLTRMAGKVWVDNEFNVVRAEAKLVSPVSFGLGVAAKVHHIGIQYRQQAFENVWLPSSLSVDFKAKVALLHTERQRIEVLWSQPYRKTDAIWAHANPIPVSKASTRR
ncbi:hypothetical protein L0222_16230 [bacterium]|nr:hypothetical protein [bacterium]